MNANNASGKARSLKVGLCAVMAVWVSGALTVPFIKTANIPMEELLIARSLVLVIGAILCAGRGFWKIDRLTLWSVPVLVTSSLTFYKAVKDFGIGPTTVVMTLAPVVNVLVAIYERKKISGVTWFSLITVIAGVILMIEPWGKPVNVSGLCYALVAMITSGALFEFWTRSKVAVWPKCFSSALPLLIALSVALYLQPGLLHTSGLSTTRHLWTLVLYGLFSGILFFYGSIVACDNLPVTASATLLQAQVVFIVIAASFVAHEHLDLGQCLGIILALSSAAALSISLARADSKETV